MPTSLRRATTLVEVLAAGAAVSVLATTIAVVTQPVQNDARLTISLTNLRNLGTASATYAAEWNDRQFTLVSDDFASLGASAAEAARGYLAKHGAPHPGITLGRDSKTKAVLTRSMADFENATWLLPTAFDRRPFGWFRMINVSAFNDYVGGRFYDPSFYAPKDTVAIDAARLYLRNGVDYVAREDGAIFWSSYCFSPAGLMNPKVLASPTAGGFKDPFTLAAGFRVPGYAQCVYPHLKTHIIEHHWLQNRPTWAARCNSAIKDGPYDGCAPHAFNHYAYSNPGALMYDGSVAPLLVNEVLDADARQRTQVGHGLWVRAPGGAADGYFESMAVDPTRTSFHIFTTDGIRGRDTITAGR